MKVEFSNTALVFEGKSNRELRRSYWLFKAMEHPALVSLGSGVAELALKAHVPGVVPTIKATVFRQFCGGETIAECAEKIAQLGASGIGTILDYSVEALENEEGFDATLEELLATVKLAEKNPHIPFCVFKMTGIARFALLAKIQAESSLSPTEVREWEQARARLLALCESAHAKKVRVFIDAEESWIQSAIDALAESMMARFNRDQPLIYQTVQMYRVDRTVYLQKLFSDAKAENYFLGLKIVRGAYMEKERAQAADEGKPSPIHLDKAASDRAYDNALQFCLDRLDRISFCVGTHNEASTRLVVQEMERRGIANLDQRIFFAQLLGMSDHISVTLAHEGYNVAKYVPYGPVAATFPYLVRRAKENTSVQGQTGRELSLILAEIRRRKA